MPPQDQQTPQPAPNPAPVPPLQPQPVQPVAPPPQPAYNAPPGPTPPPANKRKKLVLLIIIGVVLLAAGVAAGLMYANSRSNDTATTPGEVLQSPETATVRRVSWVEPFNMPAAYKKSDESADVVKTYYYDDETNDCFIATDIAPWGTFSRYGNTPKEVALDLEGTEEDGVKITKNEPGAKYIFKDVDGKQEYAFDSMELAKDLSIESLDFNKENTIVAYKPFGVYSASISITCKEEAWNAQRKTLEDLMKQFTLRTER